MTPPTGCKLLPPKVCTGTLLCPSLPRLMLNVCYFIYNQEGVLSLGTKEGIGWVGYSGPCAVVPLSLVGHCSGHF